LLYSLLAKKKYADIVIDGLGVKEYIDYKLYREHTTPLNGYNVKDLLKLGRPLNKIIIIDNIESNYQLQPNNGLNIINFEGEDNDFELEFLLKDLLPIVEKPGKNIYKELGKVRKSMLKRYTNIY
jgi:TFIIF-interacting CTD phosphatase-like protein